MTLDMKIKSLNELELLITMANNLNHNQSYTKTEFSRACENKQRLFFRNDLFKKLHELEIVKPNGGRYWRFDKWRLFEEITEFDLIKPFHGIPLTKNSRWQ